MRIGIWGALLWMTFGFVAKAQELEVKDIGHLFGEMETHQGILAWENNTEDTLRVNFWTNRNEVSFDKSRMMAVPGVKLEIPYRISLAGLKGRQSFELRILKDENTLAKGYVLETRVFEAEEDVFKAYRNEFFPFRATNQVFNLKRGFRGDRLEATFTLFNFGGEALELAGATATYPEIEVTFEGATVNHNAFTRINVVLNSSSESTLGFHREIVKILNESGEEITALPIQYSLEAKPASRQPGVSPNLVVSRSNHDFKVMEVGQKKSVSIVVTNRGQDVLDIERLEANCDCLEFEMPTRSLAHGESAELVVTFNASGRLGFERKTLALFSNDPGRPTRVLTFKAHVKEQ